MNKPSLAASLDAIFTPVQVGSVTLKNRIIMTAMGGTSPFDETADGYAFKPEIRDYYMDRVKGGVALIIPALPTCGTSSTASGSMSRRTCSWAPSRS